MKVALPESSWKRNARIAAAVSFLAVPTALLVMLFGGGRVRACLSLNGCDPTTIPGPAPIIGTTEGAIGAIAFVCVAWLGATLVLVLHVAREDRRRLARLVVAVVAATVVMAGIGFASGVANGHRLREGAESAGWFALGTAFVSWWLGLILAAWSASGGSPTMGRMGTAGLDEVAATRNGRGDTRGRGQGG
jgi:hypothetical protein